MNPHLSESDWAALAERGHEQDAPQGQVLLREGASGGSLFVILSGSVAITRGGRRIAELGEGELLGEMAVLGDGARTASAVVESDARLLVVPASAAHQLVDERPTLRAALEQAASARRPVDPDQG
ncbi:MAG: family transcriptional regulator, cyclic receptor protein [Gaiellales bacterium]|jgi:CRP-like cAMP-binding protein|nr:family transcriptional regulator, cyclic receptor protein [Gaiellales bacterium]MDX6550756.1 family transcriptional regulator, cyclic receptor protein [Gaiellales bacterium]